MGEGGVKGVHTGFPATRSLNAETTSRPVVLDVQGVILKDWDGDLQGSWDV